MFEWNFKTILHLCVLAKVRANVTTQWAKSPKKQSVGVY